jgi:hypothetical protein
MNKLSRFGLRAQKTDRIKTDLAPNNLFEHVDGLDQVQGSFDSEARSMSLYTCMRTHPQLRRGLLAALAGVGYVLLSRRR